jgi:hypothetical protein
MRRPLRLLPAAVVALGLIAPQALAQDGPEPGVTVDPSSPSGKEYALPVDKARKKTQDASKEKKKDSSAPLFGAGVKPGSGSGGATAPSTATTPAPATTAPATPPAASSQTSRSKAAQAKAEKARKARKAKRKAAEAKRRRAIAAAAAAAKQASTTETPAPAVAASAASDSASPASLGPALIIAVGGLGVLLLGGLTGLVLRRRMGTDS